MCPISELYLLCGLGKRLFESGGVFDQAEEANPTKLEMERVVRHAASFTTRQTRRVDCLRSQFITLL